MEQRKQLQQHIPWQKLMLSGFVLGAVLYFAARPSLHGDLLVFRGDVTSLRHPYWARWLFFLLALPPGWLSFLLLSLANIAGLALAVHVFGGYYWMIFTSFSFFWILSYGQIDGIVVGGIALAWKGVRTKNPWYLGIGLVLASIKPQISVPLSIFFLLRGNGIKWCSLWIPIGVFVVSIIQWGWWVPEWINKLREIPDLVFLSRNLSWFPKFGMWIMGVWLIMLWRWKLRHRVSFPLDKALIAISATTVLTVPYFPLPSIVVLLVQPVPWWVWLWAQAPMFAGFGAGWLYEVAHVLPWAILLWAVWSKDLLRIYRLDVPNHRF